MWENQWGTPFGISEKNIQNAFRKNGRLGGSAQEKSGKYIGWQVLREGSHRGKNLSGAVNLTNEKNVWDNILGLWG